MKLRIPGAALIALAFAAMPLSPGAQTVPADSEIRFTAENLIATANGVFHSWRVIEQEISPEAIEDASVVVEVDLTSVDTKSRRRDIHLRTADFFEVETYPTARVRAHSATPDGTDEEGRTRYRARFDVRLHGVEKTLDGSFVVLQASPLVIEGELSLDRLDFGVGAKPSFWNPMSIEPEVSLQFRWKKP